MTAAAIRRLSIPSPDELVERARALVPEILVKDDQYAVVRPRIEVDELIAMDRQAPWL